jgi:hypothetical protein
LLLVPLPSSSLPPNSLSSFDPPGFSSSSPDPLKR